MNKTIFILLVSFLLGACTFTGLTSNKSSKISTTKNIHQNSLSPEQEWSDFLKKLQEAIRAEDPQKLESLIKYGELLKKEWLVGDSGFYSLMPSSIREVILQANPKDIPIVLNQNKKDKSSLEERHFTYDERDDHCKKDPGCMGTLIHLYIGKYKEGYRIIGSMVAG